MDNIKITDIKRGDVFWECESGKNAAFFATADATREDEGTTVYGRCLMNGKTTRFYARDNAGSYGPRLYCAAQYTPEPNYRLLMASLLLIVHQETQQQQEALSFCHGLLESLEAGDKWTKAVRANVIKGLHSIVDAAAA